MIKIKGKRIFVGQVFDYIILAVLIFLLVYPLGMALWCSFKSQPEFEASKWFPTLPLNFENVAYAAKALWQPILNTVFVGGVGTLGVLIVSSLAAYAFAKMEFFLKNVLYGMVIGLMMIPAIMTLVPSFMLYKQMVGTNTYTILILPIITGGSVFGIFLLRGFFEGISDSIVEAAKIDGASEFRCYLEICLPLSLPILATLAISQLTGTWNDYLWPSIAIPTDATKLTIAAYMQMKFVSAETSYPVQFSGYLIASIPLILLFIFSNRFYVEGLTNAAVKF